MQGALTALKQELGALRTGRASAHLLDPIHVEAYGQNMPLNQLATVSVRSRACSACRYGIVQWFTRSKRRSWPPISA
jgi:hypothetical protein